MLAPVPLVPALLDPSRAYSQHAHQAREGDFDVAQHHFVNIIASALDIRQKSAKVSRALTT